jgi:hypothetical protein
MAVYGDYQVYLNFRQSFSGTGLSGLLTVPAQSPSLQNLTSGTGANEVDNIYSVITTAAATTTTLDLTNLTTPTGTVDFTSVKLAYFTNLDPTNSIVFGGGSNDQTFGNSTIDITVPPGGVVFFVNPGTGWTVTSGSTNEVTINPGSHTIQYQLVIVGV